LDPRTNVLIFTASGEMSSKQKLSVQIINQILETFKRYKASGPEIIPGITWAIEFPILSKITFY
jgi:hypothetical protein